MNDKGCICQKCGRIYKVDINISDELWRLIKPRNKSEGNGLLCGICIIESIESFNKFDAYKLTKIL